jgi:hypothetical protein
MVFLYGDEVSERALPLNKKEIEQVKLRREEKKDFVVGFDRLPGRLYVVSFDSEKEQPEVQESLRRSAMKLIGKMEEDKVKDVAVTGAGVLAEEVVALLEGLSLADYSFDR